jgi:mono/diheme cytochrome c family protein
MKSNLLVISILLFIGNSCTPPQKITYELTPKHPLIEKCEEGKKLYLINCAKCHNTGKRKNIIPDFTNVQLSEYTLRMASRQHDSTINEELLPEEELEKIITFFRFKQKNEPTK